jgi:hypothetical protein
MVMRAGAEADRMDREADRRERELEFLERLSLLVDRVLTGPLNGNWNDAYPAMRELRRIFLARPRLLNELPEVALRSSGSR